MKSNPLLRAAVGLALLALFGIGSIAAFRGADRADGSSDAARPADVAAAPAPVPPTQVAPTQAASGAVEEVRPLEIPDTPLIDQDGRAVRFHSDLVRGRVVAINFIFTTCRGVCPPMGSAFGKLAAELRGRGARLISVSVDPTNDTPERLNAWAGTFGAGADWTLVTGAKQDVDGLLRALGVFSADKANHSPFILLGDDRTRTWRRMYGLSPVEDILAVIEGLGPSPASEPSATSTAPTSQAQRFFTDVPLVNQRGDRVRFYSDLIREKVVVIHVFFSECKNTCPLMLTTYQKIQDHLGDRLGRDVHLISITVDPDRDGAATLEEYGERLGVRQGWHLLTGSKENLGVALGRLGLAVPRREEHSNIFLIGNDRTQYWKKVMGLAPVEQILASLDDVIAAGPDVAPPGGGE